MGSNHIRKEKIRTSRTLRVRSKVRGSTARPRLCVIKSNKHISVQLIDDEQGRTLAATATFSKKFRDTDFSKKNKESATKLGEEIAQLAKGQNVTHVVFDRGPAKYHGILAALADGARAAGLQF